jgi:hypothetical protein
MKILNQQIQAIHANLAPEIKNDPEEKASLISQYTGNVKRFNI